MALKWWMLLVIGKMISAKEPCISDIPDMSCGENDRNLLAVKKTRGKAYTGMEDTSNASEAVVHQHQAGLLGSGPDGETTCEEDKSQVPDYWKKRNGQHINESIVYDCWSGCYEDHSCKADLLKKGKWHEGSMDSPWRDNCIKADCERRNLTFKGRWDWCSKWGMTSQWWYVTGYCEGQWGSWIR
mmetsp:Transcript_11892/g.23068  ORF Transcript_11892/g.23068 Transcript_11892/m.23068 type:complete len:185 (-) Transcript_11892:137-691(-)|eukprot:CAMPEP_0172715112 /NCGR_PEP_ID=MMETSP1074-20121228/67354_1 /TAXON_ID=2916 /ORGANISM="Ceratium fusus, Strain PA161109" /LENGTH=184 /DNA_ID=CAMNT_0013539655 /DNA_START=44 /DNA_END=598 /DNA_ORIENTATION=+